MEIKEGSLLTVMSSAGGDFYTKKNLPYVGNQKTRPCIVLKKYGNNYIKVAFGSSNKKGSSYEIKNGNKQLLIDSNKAEIVSIRAVKKNIGYLSKNSQLFKNIKYASKIYFKKYPNKMKLESIILSLQFKEFNKRQTKRLFSKQFIGLDKETRNNPILKQWRKELKKCNKNPKTIEQINKKYNELNKNYISRFKEKTIKQQPDQVHDKNNTPILLELPEKWEAINKQKIKVSFMGKECDVNLGNNYKDKNIKPLEFNADDLEIGAFYDSQKDPIKLNNEAVDNETRKAQYEEVKAYASINDIPKEIVDAFETPANKQTNNKTITSTNSLKEQEEQEEDIIDKPNKGRKR